jgi:predicted nuclease with RNAse H fold
MIFVGIDLAGSEKNPTGLAIIVAENLENLELNLISKIIVKNVLTNDEVINEIRSLQQEPVIIAIDAPFSVPQKGPWRLSELQLLTKGFKPVSSLLPAMHMLVIRAIKITEMLKTEFPDAKIIETFSHAIDSILKIDRTEFIQTMIQQERLEKYGKWKRGRISTDEYDAILCALCALYHAQNRTEIIGDKNNPLDQIVLPTSQK